MAAFGPMGLTALIELSLLSHPAPVPVPRSGERRALSQAGILSGGPRTGFGHTYVAVAGCLALSEYGALKLKLAASAPYPAHCVEGKIACLLCISKVSGIVPQDLAEIEHIKKARR